MDSVNGVRGGEENAIQFQTKDIKSQESSVYNSKEKTPSFLKKHKKIIILAGIILVVVLAAAVVLIVVMSSKSPEEDVVEEYTEYIESEGDGTGVETPEEQRIREATERDVQSVSDAEAKASEILDGDSKNAQSVIGFYNNIITEAVNNNDIEMATAHLNAECNIFMQNDMKEAAFTALSTADISKFDSYSKFLIYKRLVEISDSLGNKEASAEFQAKADQFFVEAKEEMPDGEND